MKFRIIAQSRKTKKEIGPQNEWLVSVMQESQENFLQPAISVSQYKGRGYSYGEAIDELKRQLDDYINELTRFRDTVLNSPKVYQTAMHINEVNADD